MSRPVAQGFLVDLADRRQWENVDEFDPLGRVERPLFALHMGYERVRRYVRPRLADDIGGDRLAPFRMRRSNHRADIDLLVARQRIFDIAAPALDAEIGAPEVDPLDFAARMWSGAPAMIELQSIELGYTISLTGKDIADIAAFSGDIDEQKRLSADQIPAGMRDSLLDQRFWEMEDWDDFLRKGEEGYGEPETPEDSAKATPETP